MNRSRPTVFARVFVSLLFLGGLPGINAQIVTDGSLGSAGPLAGPNFAVPANLGRVSGGNLFHSFSQFNIATGESATFSGPGNIQNVLARVTGGSSSSIDGLLRSTIANANFFLINPAGVIFGANASIDVDGAFAVTTGDHVAFTDGTRFHAAPGPSDALLTSAPLASFGFLGARSGVISVQGSQLTAAPGKTLAFAGGEVQVKDAKLSANAVVIRGGKLTVDNSKIAVAAVNTGDGADVKMDASVGLTNQSSIEATAFSDFAGSTVASVSAPMVSIASGSSISSLGGGGVNAGNLRVTAEHFELTEGGRMDANTFDAGRGGDISIEVNDILIRDLQSGIATVATDAGPGGNIQLTAGTVTLGAGGIVQASTLGPGLGGSVRIDATDLSIVGGSFLQTGISADTLGGDGAAGSVQLNLTGQLTIAGGAQISSDTFGAGAGGYVIITAHDVVVDGQGLEAFTAISTHTQNASFGGSGGNISLNVVDTIQLIGGGQVTASTFGPGAGGNVEINAARVFISGRDAVFFPGISASSENQTVGGAGGDVRLNLSSMLEIVEGGGISVSTSGPGAGGSINIAAPTISISGLGSSVSAKTLGGLNGGPGGNIVITTDSLQGNDFGEISASTAGSGAGGSIDITAHQIALNNFTISADTTSPDTVAVPVTVSGLNVAFDLDHTFDQNLTLSLVGPDGTFIDLFSGVGGSGQNFRNTVLADDAPTSIADGTAPFTGRFRPLNPLAAFDGKTFNGLWVLILFDPDLSDVASLNSWSLTSGGITLESAAVPTILPNPDGSANNVSFLFVDLPPAAFVPIVPGKGGDVRVHADVVNMQSGAVISAKSIGGGASGTVQMDLRSLALDSGAFIGSSNTGRGDAGSVFINTTDGVVLRGGSLITTSAAQANAGEIRINAGTNVELFQGSSITASAGTNGGSVQITTSGMVYLLDSSITATAGSNTGDGTGGNITLDSLFIILNNSLVSANATAGRGGNINLLSSFLFNSGSSITATGAQAGTINITAPELDLGAELITLSSALLSAENRLRESCTMQLRGDFSSFITLGRGGTESIPDELLPFF